MYGHGAAPPSRSSGTVITLRVLIAAAGFLTCGLLACLPLFRVAVLRGRSSDWVLAWVSLPLVIGGLSVIGSLPEEDHRTDVALAVILLLGAFASVHFLIADIQHHRQGPPFPGYIPQRPPAAGYGYPGPASPYTATHPQTPVPTSHTPTHHTPAPHTPVPPPAPPQRPAPARIDQVRAELDELSDYLRKHEGNNGDGR
ncbi:hypothetical protein [Streptomyces sp. NPDC093544]|jgi:hypothetical protein|uniref:hypothetical protein n=1 Tax=Streptomyces sp. NPDC093544 TaxID=3155200 RepID=UPI00341EF705